MGVENILHMNTGNGELSYAKNSLLQEIAIRKTMPVLKHTIKSMADLGINIFGHCFTIADLGCSSSTNTLLVARTIIDIVDEACKENDRKAPQFQVCLNDLYGNDFNNKANICMAKTSPPNVFEAYRKQFYLDFRKFLKLRSEEIVCGGRMVLTFLGRSNADPTSDDGCRHMELLAQSLVDMLKEGLVRESDINSFNLPAYTPCEDEVRNVIHNEGSFSLDSLDVFQGNWDPYDTDYTNVNDFKEDSHRHGKNAAQVLRAVTEPLLTSHFGNSVIDAVFKKLEKHVAEHLANKKTRYFNIVISLINK
ncbi:jasmonate O-methyltransferase-like [Cynara cardunculus var. scolymus]|uniref:jasmonate O-methyltransferase-like n=1 Tax=Cynara cardunculus var. scolymus TaxID=59895 RepID=UPI000D625420|nr:jasmonate O-methyltransferase-like [Cynara cardunculus var. scolymus]